jgi:pimeloyl-ACP methyl ester carboxylesterase
MSIVNIRGIAIAYEDVGQGAPLVFIHGHPFNRSMWREQLRAFSLHYRIITPDLRGYGESKVIPGKTSLEDFACDLARLLDFLNINNIFLCGFSMGGQIALEFYRLFPERVRALILTDTFAQLDTEEVKQARDIIAERLIDEGMQGYADEVLPRMIAPKTIEELPEVAAHVHAMMCATPRVGAAAALRGRSERRDYTPLLPDIDVPTLIIVGSNDEFTPVRDAEFMHRRIPNSRIAVIDGAGHMPNIEQPAEFNRIVKEFMNTLSTPEFPAYPTPVDDRDSTVNNSFAHKNFF